jgi:hypothetical protein
VVFSCVRTVLATVGAFALLPQFLTSFVSQRARPPGAQRCNFLRCWKLLCPRDDSNIRPAVSENDDGPGRRESLCSSLQAIASRCKELRQSESLATSVILSRLASICSNRPNLSHILYLIPDSGNAVHATSGSPLTAVQEKLVNGKPACQGKP